MPERSLETRAEGRAVFVVKSSSNCQVNSIGSTDSATYHRVVGNTSPDRHTPATRPLIGASLVPVSAVALGWTAVHGEVAWVVADLVWIVALWAATIRFGERGSRTPHATVT
ncbi:MAG: hypothetical protein JWM34_3982 [Ilumatobacteraceae bacterium]|nr:hypothetical protein [Ilumatobacteraceae bacterium]